MASPIIRGLVNVYWLLLPIYLVLLVVYVVLQFS